jgi:hypothetical protein
MICASRPEAWGKARAARLLLAAAFASVPASPAAAQGWRETQAWGVAVASRPEFAGAGFGFAWRDAGRTRLSGAAALGVLEGGNLAGRVELAWHFLLDPGRRRAGLALYAGGGLALATREGGRPVARLQLALGAESAPALSRSWFVEAGVGGGVRLAAGLRWRARR